MDPQSFREWASALVPYLAFFTAFWAILTYRRAKKVEVARLQKQIFDDLYLSGKFTVVRELLDLDYEKKVAPILRHALRDEDEQLSKEDRSILIELDNFLNLIEYVLYLEADKKLITPGDRKALLAYWIEIVGRGTDMRDYLSRYGYERLAACLSAEKA